MPNHLLHETSPYLLQHAHNPVEWYPWGKEALKKAKQEDKPILVSIGYAACHWCHVMEKESFEDEATAAIMNRYFINIKIDREERPDLDHIYMDALQAMSGSGGWPLNVFLTPDCKPFYGGTYFPPRPMHNRASWTDVLNGIAQAFREKRQDLEEQAGNLTQHLIKSNAFGETKPDNKTILVKESLPLILEHIMQSADTVDGGFGKAPKFPQTHSIRFLLRYYHHTKDEAALQQACLSLDKMIYGGIYDQLGGGFARYATDTEWLAPHFEKMLYDNALLVVALSEAYQVTGHLRYANTIHHTIAFIEREMGTAQTAFYAAHDADSEGVEGKFYVWQKEEIEDILGEDAPLFCRYYDVSEKGNWEHTNILRICKPIEAFAAEEGLDTITLEAQLNKMRTRLLTVRNTRIRPQTDDKIILGWNALMNTACSKAFAATGMGHYRKLALTNMDFLLQHFSAEDTNALFHTWKNGQAKYPAFLDDYALLIEALLHLQEISSDTTYLEQARTFTEYVITHFSDEATGYFYYTGMGQEDIIIRKKEIYDGATPSGNAVMAANLQYLSLIYDIPAWAERAAKITDLLGTALLRYPTSFGVWAMNLYNLVNGMEEIAVIGKNFAAYRDQILKKFIPNKIFQTSLISLNQFPLLKGKKSESATFIYHCKNYACAGPVDKIELFLHKLPW
jgi:uncharacterized protein